jgi:cytochrome b6-f complex iron-sulfur subunit
VTNENESQRGAESADDRARRIAEAKARAEAARQARLGGAPPPPSSVDPTVEMPVSPPPSVEPTVEMPAAPPAAAAGEDDRARRIAEARARAEAARGGGTPPTAAPAAAASGAPEGAPEPSDDRAARIAEARARAQAAAAAKAGGAPPPAAAQRSPEEEAARQERIAEARARATGAAPPAAPSATPAAAAPAPAVPAAARAPAVARPMPTGPDEWRAPAGAGTRVVTARPDPGAVAARELDRYEVANLVTRRSMIRTSLWATLGVTLAGFLLGFVNFFWPRKVVGFGGLVKVPASQVPQPGADPVKIFEAKAYIVNLKPGEGVPQQFAGAAQPSKDGGILVLYQKCPHLGCTVPWRPEFEFEGVKAWFRCPCHGSTYTKAGVRVFGPAPRPMDTMKVTVNSDGSLEIDTSKITTGSTDNPQRTVKLT